MQEYDLIVLGTGGAGYGPAMRCRKAGWKVAVINEGPYSGTCAVRGCIPKKVLKGASEIINSAKLLQQPGVFTNDLIASWPDLIKFKRTFTDPMPPNTEKELREAGIELFSGAPRFVGNLQLEVNGQQLYGKKIHIAVGAKPSKLPIAGAEYLITSDDFLELEDLPDRMIFVGGGYISFEFAHIVAMFGVEATILHSDDKPLSSFDKDIVDTLIEASQAAGIKIETDAAVQQIDKQDNGFKVTTKNGRTFSADLIVHGGGRVPAIDELNLEASYIDYDEKQGVSVNEKLQSTSNPNVFAAGDAAASGPPLSPVASREGAIVADNLLGKNSKVASYVSTPSVIFSSPTVGKVGYLEAEAREKDIDFEVKITDLTRWFDSKRLGIKHAKSKILIEKSTGKIVGAHLICNHAEDLINIFSLAVELGLTVDQLKAPIMAFPTSSDDMRDML